MFIGIPHHCVNKAWPDVLPLLEMALDRSTRDYNAEDIKKCLLDRDMQLWGWHEFEVLHAVAITRIVVFPRHKVCQLLFVGGSKMKDWKKSEEKLAEWARSHECDSIEGYGRKGWLRALKDWVDCGIIVRRGI